MPELVLSANNSFAFRMPSSVKLMGYLNLLDCVKVTFLMDLVSSPTIKGFMIAAELNLEVIKVCHQMFVIKIFNTY